MERRRPSPSAGYEPRRRESSADAIPFKGESTPTTTSITTTAPTTSAGSGRRGFRPPSPTLVARLSTATVASPVIRPPVGLAHTPVLRAERGKGLETLSSSSSSSSSSLSLSPATAIVPGTRTTSGAGAVVGVQTTRVSGSAESGVGPDERANAGTMQSEMLFLDYTAKVQSVGGLDLVLGPITHLVGGLYLGLNRLTDLPKRLTMLTNMVVLDLDSNQFANFPFEICLLTQLTKLDLSNNLIKKLPTAFTKLENLEYFDIWGNELIGIENIEHNTKLTHLNIGKNKLTELLGGISILSCLQFLDISFNSLSALPQYFGNMEDLANLRAQENSLEKLPDSFSRLTNLRELDFRANNRLKLPPFLKIGWGSLKTLSTPSWQSNHETTSAPSTPPTGRSRSISSGATLAMTNRADSSKVERASSPLIQVRYPIPNLDKGYRQPPPQPTDTTTSCRIKLIVVGPPGCGKSSLIEGMTKIDGCVTQTLPKPATSGGIFDPGSGPKGISLSRFNIPITGSAADGIKRVECCSVTAWEVHGKEEMEIFHTTFVNSRPIYIVVWNSMAQFDPSLRATTEMYIGYWLDIIERSGVGADVFLVGSFFDVLESRPQTLGDMVTAPMLDYFHLQEEFSSINMAGSLFVSNTTSMGITELALRLANVSTGRQSLTKSFPDAFLKFERHLNYLGSILPFPVLDLPAIMTVAKNCGIPTNLDTIYALLKLIEDSGQIQLTNINYQSDRGQLAKEFARLLCILRADWFGDIVFSLFEGGCYEGDMITIDDFRYRWKGCNVNTVEDLRWLLERLGLLQRIDDSVSIVPFRSQPPVIDAADEQDAFTPPKAEAVEKTKSIWSHFSLFN